MGIDEQVTKAVAGQAPVKRNRFIQLDGATKSVNRELETKARTRSAWATSTSWASMLRVWRAARPADSERPVRVQP